MIVRPVEATVMRPSPVWVVLVAGALMVTDVIAEPIDVNKVLSPTNIAITSALGRCSVLHGQSLK